MLRTFGAAGQARAGLPGPRRRGRILYNPDMSLAARLARAVTGDVLFDAGSRGRYATDASIYEVEPVGVLVPKTIDDVRAAIAICREERVPVLPRGAGSSQCGQTVGAALVIDHSKHLSRDHGVRSRRDDRRRRARRGARHAQCVAQAPWPVVPGRCQHVGAGHDRRHGGQQLVRLALDRLRQHGAQRARDRRDPVGRHRSALRRRERDGGRAAADRASSCAASRRSASASASEIERNVPKVLRRVGGYNIDVCCPQSERPYTADGSVNYAHLLVGSEGTLAWSREPHVEARAAAVASRARRGQLSHAVQGDGKRAAPGRARAFGGRARGPDDDRPRARQSRVPCRHRPGAGRRARCDPARRVHRRNARRTLAAAARSRRTRGRSRLARQRGRNDRRRRAEGAVGRAQGRAQHHDEHEGRRQAGVVHRGLRGTRSSTWPSMSTA